MEILNNREISILCWSFLFLIWGLTKPNIRKSSVTLIKCFIHWRILTVALFMALYISLLIWLLCKAGLWRPDQLKSTIIWSVSVGLVSLFRINEIKEPHNFFFNFAKDIFKLTILLEFIAEYFTFNLISELIFIPLSAAFGAVMAYSQTDKQYKIVEKLFTNILAFIGLFIIVYVSYRIFSDIEAFTSMDTLRDFYTPPLLSISFLPFMYAMMVYMRYEQAFARLSFVVKEPRLCSYAKTTAVRYFHINLSLLERWLTNLVYLNIETKQDIEQSIRDLELTLLREKNPQNVPFSEGWAPTKVKQFLEDKQLILGHYHSVGGDEWHASSSYLEIGEGVMQDNIAFYISGGATVVKTLKLVLNNNDNNNDDISLSVFLDVARCLYEKALDKEMPVNIEKAILSGRRKKVTIRGKVISVVKHTWPKGSIGGYDIYFLIES